MNLLEQYTTTLQILLFREQAGVRQSSAITAILLRRLDILWVRLMEPEQHTVCNIPHLAEGEQ